MADFKIAYDITNENEGGYSNVADDHGGETYAGITRRNFPSWKGWGIVDLFKPLKQGQIINDAILRHFQEDFYKENFWDKINGDEIQSQELANQVYDFAVTAGVGAALKLLNQS